MKMSNHSKQRIRERTDMNHKDRRWLFREALEKGKSVQEIKDEEVKEYVKKRERWNSKIKLYKDYVFVYSKNSHRLYTMYKIPEGMVDKEEYRK